MSRPRRVAISSLTPSPSDEEERLAEYKSRTQRIAFFAGSAIGVIVAALGIRILELLVDPAVFDTVSHTQRRLFRTADVLLTGAVLGGGSDGLHQLVSVFTNYMESAAALACRHRISSNRPKRDGVRGFQLLLVARVRLFYGAGCQHAPRARATRRRTLTQCQPQRMKPN